MSFFSFFFFLVTSISNTRVPIFFLFFFLLRYGGEGSVTGFFLLGFWSGCRWQHRFLFFFHRIPCRQEFLIARLPDPPVLEITRSILPKSMELWGFFLLLKKMQSEGVLLFFLLEPGISVTRCRTFLHGEYFCVKIPYFFMVHLWLIFLNRLNELSFLFFSIRSYS